jgi:hypothetical protein
VTAALSARGQSRRRGDPAWPHGRWLRLLHRLRRHPFAVEARFEHGLVLTYALPEAALAPLLPPGLTLDTHEGLGFLAIALVQTRDLRPAGWPRALGQDFFLSGYRVFARLRTSSGRTLRGLRILRSDTDRRRMAFMGNLLTHYRYRPCRAEVRADAASMSVRIRTPRAEADLEVEAELAPAAAPPPGSPFADLREARKFAGPLPFTFDHEPETRSIVVIEGARQAWDPRPVTVRSVRSSFLEAPAFARHRPVLANAFYVRDLPYRWKRGVLEPIPREGAA